MTGIYYDGLVAHEFNYELPKKEELFLPCECNSEILRVSRFESEDEVYLTVYRFSGSNYSFWERLKFLFGEKVKTADLVLSKESFEKLKNF